MSMKVFSAAILSASFLAAGAASAQVPEGVEFGVGLATVGGTIEATYRIQPQLRLRGIAASSLTFKQTSTFEGAELSAEAYIGGVGLLADYYVTEGNWRLSAGVFAAEGYIKASDVATAANPFEYAGQTFNSGERLDVQAKFVEDITLMLTTGYDFEPIDNWTLSGEIGALVTGGIDLTAKSNVPALQSALDADADVQDAIRSARDINLYPYLGVTAAFRF